MNVPRHLGGMGPGGAESPSDWRKAAVGKGTLASSGLAEPEASESSCRGNSGICFTVSCGGRRGGVGREVFSVDAENQRY